LVRRVGCYRGRVLYADAGREVSVVLERSRFIFFVSREGSWSVGMKLASQPDEFFVCWAVPFAIYAKLLGEEGGEPLIEGNQVLSVFPALEFILGAQISRGEIQRSNV
jgi:hypothetical protein